MHLKAALRGKGLVDECKSSDVFVNNFCMLLKFPNFLVQMAHSKYYPPKRISSVLCAESFVNVFRTICKCV
jgi:hypothetical protein